MIQRTYLPDEIVLPCGAHLKPVIGGHLNQKPFELNGWIFKDTAAVIEIAKAKKLKYRRVAVLSRNLRGKLDLHGLPYRPTYWVFVEVKP